MKPLTISQLERLSGVSRSTIYYYISEGLLPSAQKASATRAVYNQTHFDLLRQIKHLKAQGLSLTEIRARLSAQVQAAANNGVDLVAKQSEETRNAILQTAARRFAEQGYKGTRVADICKEVGVTPQALYGQFPSKRHLFIACYEVYYNWMSAQVEPAAAAVADSAAKLAWRGWASFSIQSFTPDLQAMARVEAFHAESDLRPLVRDIHQKILADTQAELGNERRPGANPSLFDDELVSYALVGALENMQMRASWDNEYTRLDVIRNFLAVFMAVRAAYAGRIDLTGEWEAVAPLVKELVARLPHSKALPEDN